jgi:hypothetical protein
VLGLLAVFGGYLARKDAVQAWLFPAAPVRACGPPASGPAELDTSLGERLDLAIAKLAALEQAVAELPRAAPAPWDVEVVPVKIVRVRPVRR